MKIAVYHELHKGGARRGTNEFAYQLKKLGHRVDLYTIDNICKNEKKYYSKIYSYYFYRKIWKGRDWKIRLYKDTIELVSLAIVNKKIANIINKKKYDLVYVTASQFIESPFILNFVKSFKFYYLNDPYYRMIYEKKLFKPLRKDLLRTVYENLNRYIRKLIDINNIKKIDFVIAASNFTQLQFSKIYNKKSSIAYYGVDCDFFKPSERKKDIDILFIGSKDVLDGYPFFKKIINHLKIKLNIKIVLFENEWLDDNEIREVYQRTKILIATSYNEPLGLIPLEAMACGVVTLAVNEGGYMETVKNNVSGFVIKRNHEEFIQKITALLTNDALFNKMSSNAIKYVNNEWSWEKRGKELERLLELKLTTCI